MSERQFLLFSTKSVKMIIKKIDGVIKENKENVPEPEFMENIKMGGIQSEL